MSMDERGLRGWLGEFYDELDEQQRGMLVEVSGMVEARWADPDEADARQEAMSGASMVLFGDETDRSLADQAAEAMYAMYAAQARLAGAIMVTTLADPDESEAAMARRLGVHRDTVRKARGK